MNQDEIDFEIERKRRSRRAMYLAETILVSTLLLWFTSLLSA
ncbi:hypothetical protein [Roseivivax sediminis]|uniref:Uncharacterized protein n=1 Tax=Roseivivax sediminis TaxID=936889 RepID=A0A1I1VUK0_9RHOB|nr:hypothetical protein [Roseivivax sediminis]SFD84230.1 hypothetical protein SAMN04515678_103299 [Roseivivax sediminis]